MKAVTFALVALALGAAAPAGASEKLAQEKQCMGCHAIDKDGAAPAFKNIAAKWKGKKGAESTLSITIRRGSKAAGGPHWGKATMPNTDERPQVSLAEGKKLAQWVLAQ